MEHKIDWSKIDFYKLSALSGNNAEEHLACAKVLAEKEKYGQAYFLLTLYLEELAKSIILRVKGHNLTERIAANGSACKPALLIDITDKKIKDLFQSHGEKRITVATQLILLLLNTFDDKIRAQINSAIENKNPKEYLPLEELLRVFKRINQLRDRSIYVEADGSNPRNISKTDYEELLGVCERAIGREESFTCYTNRPYSKTEEDIKKMLEQV